MYLKSSIKLNSKKKKKKVKNAKCKNWMIVIQLIMYVIFYLFLILYIELYKSLSLFFFYK